MNFLVADIGGIQVTDDKDYIIKTYALGSCVGVMIYDKILNIAGLAHIALPDSLIDKEKSKIKPGYYADTGVGVLIEMMKQKGAKKENVWVKIAGGSSIMDPNGVFDIGKRNVLAVKKALWRSGLGPIKEDVGGSIGRTVTFYVSTGRIIISSGKDAKDL